MLVLSASDYLLSSLLSSISVGLSGLSVTATAGLLTRKKRVPAKVFAAAAMIASLAGLILASMDVAAGGAGGRAHKLCSSPTICWVNI